MSELTLASMKSRYRKTFAGFIWVILNPVLMFGVQCLVFKKFLNIPIPDYFLFLLGGLLPWIFVTQTIQMGTPVFVNQAQLLRSFKIDPMVLLAAQVMDNFINFLMSFILLVLPFYVSYERSFLQLTLLPLAMIPLLVGTLSSTISLSVLNVFYRDINFVIGFIFGLLFFLTPIFYTVDFIPEDYRWVIYCNPILYMIKPFQLLIHNKPDASFWMSLLQGVISSVLLSVLCFLIWRRKKNDFYRKL